MKKKYPNSVQLLQNNNNNNKIEISKFLDNLTQNFPNFDRRIYQIVLLEIIPILAQTLNTLSNKYSTLFCTLLMTDLLNEVLVNHLQKKISAHHLSHKMLMKPQVAVTSLDDLCFPGVIIIQLFHKNPTRDLLWTSFQKHNCL